MRICVCVNYTNSSSSSHHAGFLCGLGPQRRIIIFICSQIEISQANHHLHLTFHLLLTAVGWVSPRQSLNMPRPQPAPQALTVRRTVSLRCLVPEAKPARGRFAGFVSRKVVVLVVGHIPARVGHEHELLHRAEVATQRWQQAVLWLIRAPACF